MRRDPAAPRLHFRSNDKSRTRHASGFASRR